MKLILINWLGCTHELREMPCSPSRSLYLRRIETVSRPTYSRTDTTKSTEEDLRRIAKSRLRFRKHKQTK